MKAHAAAASDTAGAASDTAHSIKKLYSHDCDSKGFGNPPAPISDRSCGHASRAACAPAQRAARSARARRAAAAYADGTACFSGSRTHVSVFV